MSEHLFETWYVEQYKDGLWIYVQGSAGAYDVALAVAKRMSGYGVKVRLRKMK